MIKIKLNKKGKTVVRNEEYFPIVVVAGDDIEDIRYVEIASGSGNLIEFAADKETGQFLRMKLVMFERYSVLENHFDQIKDVKEGTLVFDETPKYETDEFTVTVFQNAVQIILKEAEETVFYKNGNVIVGVDSFCNPVSIEVVDLDPSEINHILDEMEYSANDSKLSDDVMIS